MKKVMLIYPPGNLYQRGEDRCQINIKKSSANSMRACNDLGYASAVLKKRNYKIFLKDYQSENLNSKIFFNDIKDFLPDIIFISTTNATIIDDLALINEIKKIKNDVLIILKGAIFYDLDEKIFDTIDFSQADYLIGGEEEFIIGDLIDYHYNNKDKIKNLPDIYYKENNKFIKTKENYFFEDLDSLPFPDRYEMNNDLYIMPDTEEKLATISTSRGCPSSCIYCLSPLISGKKVRFRSTQNVLDELIECYDEHNIRNFFFKADTFTINKKWTLELCEKIINSKLKNKINWVANSRVDTIDEEIVRAMKNAGCSLIAFGLESGNNSSLKKMKKNTTIEDNYRAVQLAKKIGLKTFGFYIIGFPWETKENIEETRNAIFKNDTDFIEIHVATPFQGTELYKMTSEKTKIENGIIGKNHFEAVNYFQNDLDKNYIERFRKKILLEYYTRPKYLTKKIIESITKPRIFLNYTKYGIRLLKNTLWS